MFLVMMVPALIASLAAYFFIPKQVTQTVSDEEPAPETKPPYVNILKKPSLWLFSLAAICWNIPYWGFLGWMPSYLSLARDIDLKTMGMVRSEEHTSELQSLMRISYDVFCLKKKNRNYKSYKAI